MNKKARIDWTRVTALTILCVPFFSSGLLLAQETDVKAVDDQTEKIRRVEKARDAAEDRAIELNAALIRMQQSLEDSRKECAALFLENKQLREERAYLRFRAENLMVNDEDLTAAAALSRVVNDMRRLRTLHSDLYQQILELGTAVQSTIDVLDPEAGPELKKVYEGRLDRALQALNRAEKLCAAPVEPKDEQDVRRTCRLLEINRKLQIVVLDAGRRDRVSPGMIWTVTAKAGSVIKLKVIETHQTISGAIVVEGALADLAPGNKAAVSSNN